MKKTDFIDALKKLIDTEDLMGVRNNVNDLRQQFEDYLIEETRLYQIAELEAAEKGEEFTQEDWMTPLKESFYEIYSEYNEKQRKLRDERKAVLEANLSQKRALIRQFQDLINDEENIGAAFAAHKEISDKWKTIGDIPHNHRHDIQQQYSRLQEDFFYNIRIYKDIKDYDFQKNFEAKQGIIEKLKALLEVDNVRQLETDIKQLQNDWDDIGPTKQELWEKIKDEYWDNVNKVYEKIRGFYEELKEKRKENLALKKGLIQNMEELLSKERDSVKLWNDQTQEVIKLQADWKAIGMAGRKEGEEVWKKFRALCDDFFDQKNVFFEKAHEKFDKVAEVKKGLIQKVDAIKDSTEWGDTTKAIIDIQKQWKKAGNAGRRSEQKLWKQFRAACDHFFNAKSAHFEEQDKEFEGNLKEKETLIEEIKAFKLPEDTKEAVKALKTFSEQFASIGFVPRKQKDQIYQDYKAALNKHYDSIDLSGVEKEKILFQARLNTIKGSGDAEALFDKEKRAIRNEISKVEQQIVQYENNLGFFANSKGTNPLKEQAEKSLDVEREKLNKLKAKLKLIPNE